MAEEGRSEIGITPETKPIIKPIESVSILGQSNEDIKIDTYENGVSSITGYNQPSEEMLAASLSFLRGKGEVIEQVITAGEGSAGTNKVVVLSHKAEAPAQK